MQRTILYYVIVCLVLISNRLVAQDSLSLDVLKAPSSPSSVILGINPTEIERPTDATGLMLSLRNATNEFTSVPSSFAIDIVPKWLFDRKSISFADFTGNKFKETFTQSFSISVAHLSQNDENYKGLKQAFGIKFSLLRGKISDTHFFAVVDTIRQLILNKQRTVNQYFDYLKSTPPYSTQYKNLNARLQDTNNNRQEMVRISFELEILDSTLMTVAKQQFENNFSEKNQALKKLELTITPVRKGFFVDLSAGTLLKYDNFVFNRTALTNNSIWLNAGYEGLNTDRAGRSYFSVLAISRFIHNNADQLFKTGINNRISSWDNGLRIAFTTLNQKLTFSGELVSRQMIHSNLSQSSKYLLNFEYKIGKNQKLTFGYGKDFANSITKEGNVIGILNFVTGFASGKMFR